MGVILGVSVKEVGDIDGELLGIFVGLLVDNVGVIVGDNVGDILGVFVGDILGLTVGS